MTQAYTTDVIIIGAGPVGLFAVFELGLLKMKAHLIDVLDKPGGQCIELYPDKPIYDIPGLPEVTGYGLIQNLLKQISPFSPTFHLNQTVDSLENLLSNNQDPLTSNNHSPLWRVTTSDGISIQAPVIFIAAGNGVFTPRKLDKPGALELERIGKLHYFVKDRKKFDGRKLLILGGGDSAFDWANTFKLTSHVTLVHRSTKFSASPSSVESFLTNNDHTSKTHRFMVANVMSLTQDNSGNVVALFDNGIQESFDYVLVFFGLVAKLGPLEDWGFPLMNRQIQVNTCTYETDKPGIFAIGDINTYENKRKLILSGFHEAALAAHKAYEYVYPGQLLLFQYSTSSKVLHHRLGKV